MANPMKSKLEALLENFRERGAVLGKYKDGTPRCTYEEYDSYRAGHDALAPLLVKAVETLKLCAESGSINSKWAAKTITEIEAALLIQGTEARGEGEKR